MITELTINFDMTGLDTVSRTSYVKDWKDYENVLEQAKKKESENSAVYFYRTEEMERKTKMMRRCPAITLQHSFLR